jgi:hypothetical protein
MKRLMLLALVAACGGEEARPEAIDAAPPAPRVVQPTPEQERALVNPLHRAHLEASKPAGCGNCHRIVGHARDLPTTHRCLGCHPSNNSAIHASVQDDQARECLTCHNFLARAEDPWTCATCHITGEDVRQIEIKTLAPKIEVHGREWCGNCHVPHGETAVAPRACVECHRETEIRHRKVELVGPQQCQECHQGHEPGASAVGMCASCHKEKSTATFKGHDACATCHQPHDARTPIKSCNGCHEQTRTLGAPHVGEHARCQSCHDSHRVKAAPVESCRTCHATIEAKHPPDARQRTCAGCHPIHSARGQRAPLARAQSCASCHVQARTETGFHAGGVTCVTCHRPHAFAMRGAGLELCSGCHGGANKPRAGQAAHVMPVKGHDDCAKCHREAAHAPASPTPGCETCHAPEQRSLTRGHEKCKGCHRPHDGGVKATCSSCHARKETGLHSAATLKRKATCQSCHRAHGPGGATAPMACASCHQQQLPGMHQHAAHRDCTSCHGFHEQGPRKGRTACLEPCHTAQVNHEPAAQSCTGCHPFGGVNP